MDLFLGNGEIFAIAAALCWSIGTFLFGAVSRRVNSFVINLLASASGLVLQIAIISLFGDFSKFLVIDLKIFGLIALIALTGYVIGRTLYLESLKLVGVSVTLPLTSIQPLFTFVLALIFLGEVVTPVVLLATVIIIAGVWMINNQKITDKTERQKFRRGVTLGLAASVLWSLTPIVVSYLLAYIDVIYLNSARIMIQIVMLSIILLTQGKFSELFKLGRQDIIPISLGGFFTYFFSVTFFMMSISMIGVSNATPLARIYPLFGFFLAILFLKEKFTYVKLMGTVAVVLGVLLITF